MWGRASNSRYVEIEDRGARVNEVHTLCPSSYNPNESAVNIFLLPQENQCCLPSLRKNICLLNPPIQTGLSSRLPFTHYTQEVFSLTTETHSNAHLNSFHFFSRLIYLLNADLYSVKRLYSLYPPPEGHILVCNSD